LVEYLNIHAEQIIWIVVLFLTFFSVIVFVWAIFSRWMLNRREKLKTEVRSKLSDLIIRYVSGDLEYNRLQAHLSSKIDYSILSELSNELEKTLEGEEKKRIIRLLNLPPIRNFFIDNFDSGDVLDKAKASLYFSRQNKIKSSLVPKLLTLTSSKYPMLAYASAMAIMVHGNAEQVKEAIHNVLENREVSDQALNDIFNRLQARSGSVYVEEPKLLIELISDGRYSASRTSQMIRTLGELNFYESAGFLLDMFKNLDPDNYNPKLATSFIDVLAHFGMNEIVDDLHEIYTNSKYREVRESVAKALGIFRDPVSKPILKWLMLDADYYVRFFAAYSLAKYEDVDLYELDLPGIEKQEYRELIGEIESSDNREGLWV